MVHHIVKVQNDPTAPHPSVSYDKTLTKTRDLQSQHTLTGNKVIGPDNFRFVTGYWTNQNVQGGIDVGTSVNSTYLGADSQPSNPRAEVDSGDGLSTYVISLKYKGVVQLAGITAALKLPKGFKSEFPLIHNSKRYDIAFSEYRGHIYPGEGIALYFNIYPSPDGVSQKPYLTSLALHTLRLDVRTKTDIGTASMQDQFASVISVKNATPPFIGDFNIPPSTTTFNENYDRSSGFNIGSQLIKPFDFVSQVIPVYVRLSGSESLRAIILPWENHTKTAPAEILNSGIRYPNEFLNAQASDPTNAVQIPAGVPTKVRLMILNVGDLNTTNLQIYLSAREESALSATSVPSSTNIPNTVQQNAILPVVIQGETTKWFGPIPAYGHAEFDMTLIPSAYAAGTVEYIKVVMGYDDVTGNHDAITTRLVGFQIVPNNDQSTLKNISKIPNSILNVALNPKLANTAKNQNNADNGNLNNDNTQSGTAGSHHNLGISRELNSAANQENSGNGISNNGNTASDTASSKSNAAGAATAAAH